MMCNRKLLLTALAVLLGGLSPLSYAADRLINATSTKLTTADPDDGPVTGIADGVPALGATSIFGQDGLGVVAVTPATTPPTVNNTAEGTYTPSKTFNTDSAAVGTDILNVINIGDLTGGVTLAKEVLQSGDAVPVGKKADGSTETPNYAAVAYIIDGKISKAAYVTFTLTGAVFAEDPWFKVYSGYTGTASVIYPGWDKNAGGSGSGSVKYRLDTSEATQIGGAVPAVLYLLYQVENINADEVKMSVKLETTEGNVPLGSGEVTIFTLSSALTTAKMSSERKGDVYLSVADDNKLLTDNGEDAIAVKVSDEDAFRDTVTARIGYLELGTTAGIYEPDCTTEFTLGTKGTNGEVDETASELVISGGQFDASKLGPGKVRLLRTDTGAEVANVVATDGTATFALTNTILTDIVAAYKKGGNVAIEFVTDTTNPVNLVDAPPKATLTLTFKDADIKLDDEIAAKLVDVELRQIFQNGTVCWAFNVPYETVQDQFNIRITNESAIPGSFTVTLYQPDGSIPAGADAVELAGIDGLVTGKAAGEGTDDTVKKYLKPGNTLHLNAAKLQAGINGVAWANRAVVKFVTELPDVEMLAMLRNQLMDEASQPLNNFSLGAHGKSCIQGGQ